MGNTNLSEQDLKWSEQEKKRVEDFLETQKINPNPNMVPFHEFKFPNSEEDPVEIIVKDYDDKVTEYRLKSYRYPPFHDLKDC